MIKKDRIYVTKPSLPPLEEFIPYLKKIWKSKWLTNNGKFHQQFEKELAGYLGVKYVSLFTNGTLALMTALQALNIKGEVITTPYSFVATSNVLLWNNLSPIFVDIEPKYCNLDPNKIEDALTPNTSAILPVHVYGNPCDVERIQKIADKQGLKVIYDAAHAFGVKYKGRSVLNYGDLSILSFHATKVFNTMEGGAIISHTEEMKGKIDYLKNFGFDGETSVVAPGINSKMNEMQAALGLLQLKNHNENVNKRKEISDIYIKGLENIEGIEILTMHPDTGNYNYSYFPIFIDEIKYKNSRDLLHINLKERRIYCRRYFYPLISQFSIYNKLTSSNPINLQNAERVSKKVLCLPIYTDLLFSDVEQILNYMKC